MLDSIFLLIYSILIGYTSLILHNFCLELCVLVEKTNIIEKKLKKSLCIMKMEPNVIVNWNDSNFFVKISKPEV